MNKIVFMMSHTPIPRTIKRINVALKAGNVNVIYWDRVLNNELMFSVNEEVNIEAIKIKAPQGKPLKRLALLPIFFLKALKKLNKIKPSLLHVFNFDMLLVATYYKKIYDKNIKIIYEIGDLPKIIFRENIISNLFTNIETRLLKSVDKLIITSEKFYNVYYINIIEKEKKLYIPNVPSKKILDGFIDKRKGIPNVLNIGFIGSIRYFNELKILCDYVEGSNRYYAKFAGTGVDYEKLEYYSRGKKNISLSGAYDYIEVTNLYKDIDLVYSVYDNNLENVKYALPNRLYEAILFEKPIIVTKGTYLSEIVDSLNIGYSIENNYESLATCLEEIYINPVNCQLKKANCKKIKTDFYLEKYEDILYKLYKNH